MNRLLSWLLVVLWASFIFTFSADLFSSEHTASIILPVLHWLLPRASGAALQLIHILIRKCAHIFEYFIFGLLLFRAVRGPRLGWSMRWAVALLIAAVFAASDEFHQVFVPSRSASGWDALLDASAAAAAQAAMWLAATRTDRASGNRAAAQTP